MRVILCPVDFSDVTESAIEVAVSLGRAFGAEITLLHTAAPDPDFVGYEPGPKVVRDARAREIRAEHRSLQETAERLRESGLDAKALLVQGPTVETILAEARKLSADAIVMGSHGHGALYRALVGSVAEGVLRGAPCPVVVVPARAADST